ncbi:MAG: patatin-like phospholipase family protein [Elusimicrobiales bacterium]|nr:patatin-like phospholipase family protein [Elusimicrobiales bacterium]
MFKFKRPVGLFLCGGGALGSWQSGVLAELVRQGLHFDVVAGFSVGALNGAAYCYNKTGELRQVWRDMKPETVLSLKPRYYNIPLELYQQHEGSLANKFNFFFQNQLAKLTLFSNKQLYNLLNGWLVKSGPQFPRNIKFYVISHAVEMKLPYIVRFDGSTQSHNLSFTDALVASCSIPMIFPPVPVEEHGRKHHLVDGGVIGIATINLSIFEGCRTVIMIGNSRPEDMDFHGKGPIGYFERKARRMLALHTQKIYESRVFLNSEPDVYLIKPPTDLGLNLLEFDGAKCEKAFDIGEAEAKLFLHNLEQPARP